MGYAHPDVLLRELDSHQIAEWMAYSQLEPFGDQEAFWRSGMVASTIANANKGKNTKAFAPEDFMPKLKKPKQSIEEIKEVMMGFVNRRKRK